MLSRVYAWVTHHKALTLLILLLLGLSWASISRNRQLLPTITRTLDTSTQQVNIAWVRQDLSASTMASNAAGMIFALSSGRDQLLAFNSNDGKIIWQVSIPIERSGIREIAANDQAVFAVGGTYAYAYTAPTGELLWSIRLGSGHVSVIPQLDLDADVLRIYYGDKLYEIAPDTGEVLSEKANGGVYWILDKVTLYALAGQKLMAVDQQTNEHLWTKDRLFFIDEGQAPRRLNKDLLLVARQTAGTSYYTSGICALWVRTSNYLWCRPETYLSNVAIDSQSHIGYVLRDDFVLATIDLQDGNLLNEIGFLPSALPDEWLHSSHDYSVIFSAGVVVVAFGDSGQTFGLLLNNAG